MPISPALNFSSQQAQQAERLRSTQSHPGFFSGLGLNITDTWHRSSESARRATPTWIPTVIGPKPLAAVGCAVCTNAVLFAARIAVPTLAIPSIGVHVGVTLTALTFGWFVIEHRFGALGSLIGAAVGVSIVAAYGITSLPLSLVVVFVLAAGLGGALGSSCDGGVHEEDLAPEASNEDETEPLESGASTELEGDRLQTRLSTAFPTNHASIESEHDRTALLTRLRTQIEQIDGPYAVRLKAKGVRVLREAEGLQASDNQKDTMDWLNDFVIFLETHAQLLPMTPIEVEEFDGTLEESLRGLWGNEHVKLMARQCAARQQTGPGQTTFVVVAGESGTGKNRFISLMKKAYPASQTILLDGLSRRDFAGFARTFRTSQPAIATRLLMEHPKSLCLLHIDEIDKASFEKQRALLSLLAPENEVIDGYFGLPINKQRLFVVCTMESTDNREGKLAPELWNRLKNFVSVLDIPTNTGLQAIAEMALNEAAEDTGQPPIPPAERTRVAAELALRCSAGEVGRNVSQDALKVIDRAILLKKMRGTPTSFTPSLVMRALDGTWTSEEFEVRNRKRQFIPFLGAGEKRRLGCLTLFAILRSEFRDLRWHHDLHDGRAVSVEMSADKGISVLITSTDGLSTESALSINLEHLQCTPMEPNEFLSAAQISELNMPTRLSSFGPLEISANGCQPDLEKCCIQLEENQWLLALPLVLTDTSVTLNRLLKESVSLGYDDDAIKKRNELEVEMKRIEHFANDW